jgi:hypothetical protein
MNPCVGGYRYDCGDRSDAGQEFPAPGSRKLFHAGHYLTNIAQAFYHFTA